DIEEQLQISEIKSHRSFLLLERYLGRLAHQAVAASQRHNCIPGVNIRPGSGRPGASLKNFRIVEGSPRAIALREVKHHPKFGATGLTTPLPKGRRRRS